MRQSARTSAASVASSRRADAARLRYELGEDSYLVVLDALGRQTAAELRVAELDADVRRARAELERAIGHRLGVTPREEVE